MPSVGERLRSNREPARRDIECRPAREAATDVTDSLRDGSTFPVFPMDQPGAVPQLPRVPVHFVLRDLDRGLVVVRFDPFGRRDFGHPVEAVNPVAFHCFKPMFLRRPKRPICLRNDRSEGWFPSRNFGGFPSFLRQAANRGLKEAGRADGGEAVEVEGEGLLVELGAFDWADGFLDAEAD